MLPHVSALFLLPAAGLAASFDCKHVRADGVDFYLQELGGPKEVHWVRREGLVTKNTTYTIDICKPLTKPKDFKDKYFCSSGTRVCGIEREYSGGQYIESKAIDIAGNYETHGGYLDPSVERLKGSESHHDSKREGVRAVLHGGLFEKKKQEAIIEFVCDQNMTGNEGFEESKMTLDSVSYSRMGRREDGAGEGSDEDDGEDGGEDGDDDGNDDSVPDLDAGKALRWDDYEDGDDLGVLRLTWKTKYACEKQADDSNGGAKKKGGWGFFTWFIIIVFLLAASYIIFGSWLNYNRYGARGWDLIPHGDAIRDLPYVAKDWTVAVVDRIRGSGGSRGGYSAV